MPKPTRFGSQPIAQVLLVRNIGRRDFAQRVGIGYHHVRCAVMGVTPPSPLLRQAAAAALDLPVEDLFTTAALDAVYCGHYAPGGRGVSS